ncbi:MAG: hypothetical protein M3O98_07585 [Actinomycetota bacterium]|nr:hypothetical protein [Actinomycetota bacterium]
MSSVVLAAGVFSLPRPGVAAPVASIASAAPGFVSVLFGRTQWVSVATRGGDPCVRLPDTVTLGHVRKAMADRGLDGVGVVIPPRTPETGFRCFGGYTIHPGWDRLERWDAHGWAFVSGGTHGDIRKMTYEGKLAESCGSLKAFRRHGIPGWGMYAYANNQWSLSAQRDPVSRCFDFGRRYAPFRVNHRGSTTPPWLQWTHSVNGGRCNASSLPCYRSAGSARSRYDSPKHLAALMAAGPNTWVAVQFYRFVTGAYHGSSKWTWNCKGRHWRRHYTSQWELYCYRDFVRVMNALRNRIRSSGVVSTDPATVAAAWGRVLSPPPRGALRATKTNIACGRASVGRSVTCRATVTDTDDSIPGAPIGRVTWSSPDGTFAATVCTLAGVRPSTTCSVAFTPSVVGAGVRARYRGSSDHSASSGHEVLTSG